MCVDNCRCVYSIQMCVCIMNVVCYHNQWLTFGMYISYIWRSLFTMCLVDIATALISLHVIVK